MLHIPFISTYILLFSQGIYFSKQLTQLSLSFLGQLFLPSTLEVGDPNMPPIPTLTAQIQRVSFVLAMCSTHAVKSIFLNP